MPVLTLIKVLADPYTELPSITFWLLGGLNTITVADLTTIAPLLLLGMLLLWLLRWRMNLLSLPDDEARAMGVNVTRLYWGLIVAATLVTASAVSIAGIIGWVGLTFAASLPVQTMSDYCQVPWLWGLFCC